MTKLLPAVSLTVFASLAFTGIALADGAPKLPPSIPRMQDSAAATPDSAASKPAAAKPESKTFISDGSVVSLSDLGFAITPPSGWEVNTYAGSLSLIMREPKIDAPSYDKPKYQRNITMAVKTKSTPIDEPRAKELEAELKQAFAQDASVSNFTIMEHKFFNYRGENDGLLVYSSLDIGDYHMMQTHVLISGADNQFLMTYTDLADRFSDSQDPNFAKAWSSIVSATVQGETPNRRQEMMHYAGFASAGLMLLIVALLLRRKASKRDYSAQADAYDDGELATTDASSLEGSMISTLAMGWKIKKKAANNANDDLLFSSHIGVQLGKQTSDGDFVSSY